MGDVRAMADAALRRQLTSQGDEAAYWTMFEDRYGRGWQRKLGEVLDVPETTVNGWFKAERFPPLAKLAFGLLLSDVGRPARTWIPVRTSAGYAVCDTQGRVGRIVADKIASLADATLIAAAPLLKHACAEAHLILDDARGSIDVMDDLADKLGAAIEAAECNENDGANSGSVDDGVQRTRNQAASSTRNEAS